MDDRNLRLKLESGASRVFNCLQLTRGLRDAGSEDAPAEPFFALRGLNNIIFIKETALPGRSGRAAPEASLPVRTKLFIPYNPANPYEGGQSSFTDETRFEEAIAYLTGASAASSEPFRRDLEKIRLLEQMPSLDPFLLKDKFTLSGIKVNDAYFKLSQEDWTNIRTHIRQRFVMMSRFAAEGQGEVSDEVVDRLVDRIWEARQIEPLYPLLTAFGLPVEKAAEFFYAWKGIAFFDFEFARNAERVRGFSSWLQTATVRGALHRAEAEAFDQDRAQVRAQLRGKLGETLSILTEFNESFDQLFRRRETARAFSSFMLNSRRHFWQLGNNLNGIYHVVSLWDRVTGRLPGRAVPAVQMAQLMRVLREIG
jgi:hypothetical protein